MLADINLDLGDHFHFRGFGADVDLTGRLRLQQESAQLFRANGEVRVPRGRYRAYGQRLVVRTGSFIFTGPWDNPDLNLEAIRELPPSTNPTNVVVGIKVSGPLRAPNAMLFSEPGMPESDIAYYILTGRPRATPQNGSFSAGGTLLALGLAGSGDQAGQLAKRFGIGDFQIGTVEASDGTEAEMSGYLGEKLYVRYGRGIAQRSNSITFQYRLTPRLLIETISGIEDALDLLYSFSIN
jgi:translocation and assembly module TamB